MFDISIELSTKKIDDGSVIAPVRFRFVPFRHCDASAKMPNWKAAFDIVKGLFPNGFF